MPPGTVRTMRKTRVQSQVQKLNWKSLYSAYNLPAEQEEQIMETRGGYSQFCPVAMAAEIVCTRWTALILREFLAGSTRFNDLRKGVPRMSPALLSKRLRDLEQWGIVERVSSGDTGMQEYRLTQAGQELRPIVEALGNWGHRWIESKVSLKNLDPSLLMWDRRRNLDPTPLPPRRCTIHFLYPELPQTQQNWWLVVDPALGTDLCSIDPGYEIDIYIETDLRTMTAIWMGFANVEAEARSGRLKVSGELPLMRTMQTWLGLSPFAKLAGPSREPLRVA